MKLKAHRLTARQAVLLWASFYEAHGAATMKLAYGWNRPAENLKKGEKVWSFTNEEHTIVAWATMQLNGRDPDDDDAVITLGVWPAYQGQGVRQFVYDWLARKAHRLGANQMSRIVYRNNEQHHARVLREATSGSTKWLHAGDIWYPAPGHSYFVWPLDKK